MARVDWRQINAPVTEQEQATARRDMVRDKLYYGFRYANGSYKARKAMVMPFLMTAKTGHHTVWFTICHLLKPAFPASHFFQDNMVEFAARGKATRTC